MTYVREFILSSLQRVILSLLRQLLSQTRF